MCNQGKEFEREVMAAAKLIGHTIVRKPMNGKDGGVDLITKLTNMPFGGGTFVIQCKDEPNSTINRPVVDQLIGTLEREGVPTGILVTSGKYSKPARIAARDSGRIQLIDGNEWKGIRRKLIAPIEFVVALNKRTKNDWHLD